MLITRYFKTSLSLAFSFVIFTFITPGHAGTCWNGGSSGSSPWTVVNGSGGSPSKARNDVNYCVNTAASPGDTINVTATGTATWSHVEFNQDISLIGPGQGNLTITLTGDPGLYYNPDYDVDTNMFRLSGFKFRSSSCLSSGLLQLGNDNNNPTAIGNKKKTKVRIDNNILIGSASCNALEPVIWVYVGIFGVVDNNQINATQQFVRSTNNQLGGDIWKYWAYYPGQTGYDTLGHAPAMYFEDNIMTTSAAIDNVGQSSQGGHSYVWRYNNLSFDDASWYHFDAHGNEASYFAATQGVELYGNKITNSSSSGSGLIQIRGGQGMVFNNDYLSTGTTETVITEENADSNGPGPATNDITGQTQHVSNTYIWGSRLNDTGALFNISESNHVGDIPLVNRDYFEASSWNESGGAVTAGVGCGTVSAMDAITTCSEGVGFWATDQSCSSVAGMVGRNPATPLSGTLYVCDDSNNWVEFYTPLTYPHPLRSGIVGPPGGPDTVSPGFPSGLSATKP